EARDLVGHSRVGVRQAGRPGATEVGRPERYQHRAAVGRCLRQEAIASQLPGRERQDEDAVPAIETAGRDGSEIVTDDDVVRMAVTIDVDVQVELLGGRTVPAAPG